MASSSGGSLQWEYGVSTRRHSSGSARPCERRSQAQPDVEREMTVLGVSAPPEERHSDGPCATKESPRDQTLASELVILA